MTVKEEIKRRLSRSQIILFAGAVPSTLAGLGLGIVGIGLLLPQRCDGIFCGLSQAIGRELAIYAFVAAALLTGLLWLSRSNRYRVVGISANLVLATIGVVLVVICLLASYSGLAAIFLGVLSFCFLSAGLSAWLGQKPAKLS